ncbi:MAG: polysaccharide biosynthesis C-terminal domain-containing protein [Clostridia bacterium]|nr:polysaccharide biosynthesis C-terminal domain-containing protein [Clostridia bacterium]
MKHSRQFMLQALLLGAVSILLRAIGVCFQVYVVSTVGAQTIGVSALIGSVFGFAVTLALSGIQLGCTRLVAERLGVKDGGGISRTLVCCIFYALFFGCLSAGLLFILSGPIALLCLKQETVLLPLRIMAVSLPAMALSSCISGYFIAVRRVYKSATVQIFEQLLRILLTVRLFASLSHPNMQSSLCTLATADTLACLCATAGMLVLLLHDRKKHAADLPRLSHTATPSYANVARHLLAVTLPVAVSAYARSGLISLEHLLIPIGLDRFGQAKELALASYGALQSMALPVVLFPAALPAAFANLLVPEVTESHVRGEIKRIRYIIQRVLSLALLFAIGVAGIMLCFSNALGNTLYPNSEAAKFIRLLAPLIPVMYLDSAVDAMLKGLGQQVSSMGINIIDASLSVILVWLLVPMLGIYGYLVTIYVTEIVNATLSIVRLLRVSGVKVFPGKWLLKPMASILLAALLTHLLVCISAGIPFAFTLPAEASLVLQILLTVALYLILARLFGALRQQELAWLIGLFGKPKCSTCK